MSSAPLDKSFAEVRGKKMAYHDSGRIGADATGDTFLLLHGNPTSSYLWRNIIAHLAPLARCVAPDLIGMGDSEALDAPGPDSYRLSQHKDYLYDLLEQLDLGDSVIPVVHDWGSALGFNWAMENPDRTRGIVYMEAIVQPVEWESWPEEAREIFQAFRSEAGEQLILDQNLFVEAVLPASIIRDLSDAEMEQYRRPFAEAGESRRPTLTWPREIPVGGEPVDVVEFVTRYGAHMARSSVPKLFVNAEPGAILTGEQREFARSWPNQTEVTVPGIHFIQEDSADEIGLAIREWYSGIN